MGSIVAENRKSLMLFSGRGFPELAEEIGYVLGVAPPPSDSYEFANGEIFVRFKDSVRGSDAFVVQSMTAGINAWVMETLIMVDGVKRGRGRGGDDQGDPGFSPLPPLPPKGKRTPGPGSRSPPAWSPTC